MLAYLEIIVFFDISSLKLQRLEEVTVVGWFSPLIIWSDTSLLFNISGLKFLFRSNLDILPFMIHSALTSACLRCSSCSRSQCRTRRTPRTRLRSRGTRRGSSPGSSGCWPGPPSAPGTGPRDAAPGGSASCWPPLGRGSHGSPASAHCELSALHRASSRVCTACPQYWIFNKDEDGLF